MFGRRKRAIPPEIQSAVEFGAWAERTAERANARSHAAKELAVGDAVIVAGGERGVIAELGAGSPPAFYIVEREAGGRKIFPPYEIEKT